MQIDDPARGFSVKHLGPLDMRMNPSRGQPASAFLEKISAPALATLLTENSDAPPAATLAPLLAGRAFRTTTNLAEAIRAALPRVAEDNAPLSVRRVFQALRIAVNDEFSALDTFLRALPSCLNPGGRVVILTFHSGEDRRVKKSFAAAHAAGLYAEISEEVIRPSLAEQSANPPRRPDETPLGAAPGKINLGATRCAQIPGLGARHAHVEHRDSTGSSMTPQVPR